MITVEDIERRQKIRKIIFRVIMGILLFALCLLIAWAISRIGYEELHPHEHSTIEEEHRCDDDVFPA